MSAECNEFWSSFVGLSFEEEVVNSSVSLFVVFCVLEF